MRFNRWALRGREALGVMLEPCSTSSSRQSGSSKGSRMRRLISSR